MLTSSKLSSWPALLVAVALLVAPRTISAQEETPPSLPPTVRGEPAEFHLGDFLQGEQHERDLIVHNDGDKPLVIYEVNPSCGCTTIVSFDRTIPPRTSGKIRMTVNTKKIKTGERARKAIRIHTNDPGWSAKPYSIYWTVYVTKMFETKPAKIQVAKAYNQTVETAVELLAANDLGFELVEVRSRNGEFEVVKVDLVQKDRRYIARLRIPAVDVARDVKDPLDLTIKTRDGRQVTVGRFVEIRHLPGILVNPEQALRFKNKDTDALLPENAAPISRAIDIRTVLPNVNFKVTGVQLTGRAEQAFGTEIVEMVPGKHYAVKVTISEYQKSSYISGKIVITTDSAERPTIEMPVSAMFGRRRK